MICCAGNSYQLCAHKARVTACSMQEKTHAFHSRKDKPLSWHLACVDPDRVLFFVQASGCRRVIVVTFFACTSRPSSCFRSTCLRHGRCVGSRDVENSRIAVQT